LQRTGVAIYRIKLNGSTVDTLSAPSAGLGERLHRHGDRDERHRVCDSSRGANGGKWVVATTGTSAYGLESAQNDAVEEALASVAGTTPCVYGQPAAIPASASYNKAFVDIRNSSSATAAHIAGVVLRQTSPAGYYLQYSVRPSDGGSLTTSTSLSLTGVAYVAVCIASNVATVYYSYDGGSWVVGFSNIAITLTDSKLAGCGVAATNNGSTGVAISVDFTYCQVTSSGRASKTVSSSCTVTCLWAMTAIDAESVPNESAATGGVSAIPNSSSGASLKFSPGHYVRAHTHNLSCGTDVIRSAIRSIRSSA
jgi:microcompartment protein CcmK/EutM